MSRIRRPGAGLIVALVLLATALSAAGLEAAPPVPSTVPPDHARQMVEGLALFSQHVRPILVRRCLKCHGGEAEVQSGFNLATREKLLAGGTNGKSVIVGDARHSRLFRLIAHAEEPYMPQDAPKLADAEIAKIARWIDRGAPYDAPLIPSAAGQPSWTRKTVDAKSRRFWSFQPLRMSAIPSSDAGVRNPVDAFLQAALHAKNIEPNPEAGRTTLIRRLYFDLLGLPPTPAEISAFVADRSPGPYDALVDRLLASPHYGQRWARHWLDLARFAESHGFEHDYDRPTAYHFRDFVIRALDSDLPYDTFLRWQLAGDELAPHNSLALMATGFLAAGVHSTQITKNEVEKQRYDELDDMLATTGTAMLGLSIGCARCHDHKFDPIPQADYYRMLSTFTTTVRSEIPLNVEPSGRPPRNVKVLVASEGLPPLRLHSQGDDFFKETFFLRRGDATQKEGVAPPGMLQVLMRGSGGEAQWVARPPAGARTSYRRTALAAWLTDTRAGAGPLAARVIVNRLWQHHLGRGIVATPNDFGTRGDPPSHPELLDWLAGELIRHGWQLKPIHKLIVTSAAYRESSQFDPAKAAVDPGNRLVWRHEKRRLEGEIVRDALLACGRSLDERMYGPGTLDENQRRRSLYFTVKRSQLVSMMQVFDAPEALTSIGDRPSTTIAPQALLLLNNPNVRACSLTFARRIAPAWGSSPRAAVEQAYRIAIGRDPDADELSEGMEFLERQSEVRGAGGEPNVRARALSDFCQVLLCLNEFVYVD